AFFDMASEALAVGLGYRWSGVAWRHSGSSELELLAFYGAGRTKKLHLFDLTDSPCMDLYNSRSHDSHIFLERGVAERFYGLAIRAGVNGECYRGEVFYGPDGKAAGHVFAISDRVEADEPDTRSFFRLVSQRVGAEYNRWRAEQALHEGNARTRAANQRLREAVESISDAFVLYDAEDRLVLFNRKWIDFYGYDAEDATPGITYEDLVRLDAKNGTVAGDPEQYVRQRLAYRRQFRGSLDLRLSDGRWITVRETPTLSGGIVSVQTEITDRMETLEALSTERTAAEQANEAKSDFVSKMSHELRTPLNAILGFAEIIKDAHFGPVGNPKYKEYAGDILTSANHVLDLINTLLDLARIESGEEGLREEALGVGEKIRTALVFLREAAARKNIAIELFLSDGLPKLHADRRKMKQILVNLLANGIKYNRTGGRIVISVRASEAEGFIFEIADTGPGIAAKDIDSALKPYGRIGSTFPSEPGTGLGLPLAASFVELHGGKLEIDSAVGFGTMVTVTLPWTRALTEPSYRRSPG
ncbi:MAG: PAS-domain containing protein, partial [Alphaproteobacteria bacterium]|nr:PAS-domain containing protein [Alphaproteobacteria bacterium]